MTSPRARLLEATIVLALATLLGGCVTMPFGSPARPGRLEQLKPGVSTAADVLLLLGEPRGDGAVRWTPSLAPQAVWYYEYVVLSTDRIDNQALLVFFDRERYAGYLWFSSLKVPNE